MFWKKRSSPTAESPAFRETKIAKGLVRFAETELAKSREFAKERNIPHTQATDQTPSQLLELAATILVGERFLKLISSLDFLYLDGSSDDTVPGAVALSIVHIMLDEIAAALADEKFSLTDDFLDRAPASTLIGYMRFHSEQFQRKVLEQSLTMTRSLSDAQATVPNVAELIQNIRLLTVASIIDPNRIEGQESKVDQAFAGVYRTLLGSIERGPRP
ncbi:MAG: hypothetical protein C0421_02930 [Hyphomonas sp.]|uniref:hypothetical protein n=1 Tax=Hyphomonas sp. TaxID=87 RepID=UPI0025C12375|nr:hypothetical protein [Hyphomonas sp.]MBA4337781.1 hypothetical protein [Hyphomonas sp.]